MAPVADADDGGHSHVRTRRTTRGIVSSMSERSIHNETVSTRAGAGPLRRTAGAWGIWAIPVAAVIAGDIAGWNSAIAGAGWGGVLIATVVVIAMYFLVMFSLGETTTAYAADGPYAFARAALGPRGEFATGLADTVKYVVLTAAVVYFSANYADRILQALLGAEGEVLPRWVWWLILYGVFVALNSLSSTVSMSVTVVLTVCTVAGLVAFGTIVLFSGRLDISGLFDIVPDAGMSSFLPHGIVPIFFALPFAIWLFMCIEMLGLTAGESRIPVRRLPDLGILGMITLTVTATIVFVLSPAIIGASATGASTEPMIDAVRALLPDQRLLAVWLGFALLALFASIQGVLFGASRNLVAMSRAGHYARALSSTGSAGTPWAALVTASIVGIALLGAWEFYRPGTAGALTANVATWGAVASYLLQLAAFVVLRRRMPSAERPYRSPTGVIGAVVAGIIAALIGLAQLLNPDFRPSLVVFALCFVGGLAAHFALRRVRRAT